MDYKKYFEYRGVFEEKAKPSVPKCLDEILPDDKSALILDFGCGFGHTLLGIKERGYSNVVGMDISAEAINFLTKKGVIVYDGNSNLCYEENVGKVDLIVASHVLEHIPKEVIIPLLEKLYSLLKSDGKIVIMVPNAQSNTGSYWFFEDFTHQTLFTSGSIYFVLRSAGFKKVTFLDPTGTDNARFWVKPIKKMLLKLYGYNKKIWNKVTGSAYHGPSPTIFTYEIKVLAEKE